MKRTYWDNLTPRGETLDQIIYNIRKDDAGQGLLLDAVQVADIYGDFDGLAPVFDALAVKESKLDRVADWMKSKMDAAGLTVTTKDGQPLSVLSVERLPTLTKGGFANIPIHYKLSDGQTVTIYFHNPDATPKSFKPTDEMIAWKWLLNKKDVTIAVASDDSSKDLDVKVVAMRIIKLAAKNSAAFQRANAKVSERAAQLEGSKTEVAQLENTLTDKQNELEALKAELLSKQAVPQPEPTIEPTPEPVIEPVVTPKPETVQPLGQIDPATLANLNASSLSAAIRKKAIAFFEKNPAAKSFEGSGLSKPSQKAIMESIKTALFAEIKALSLLFSEVENFNYGGLSGDYVSIEKDGKSLSIIIDSGTYLIQFIDGNKENQFFDSTSTVSELENVSFKLPIDLNVKAFVANVIKPVVEAFLSKQQSSEQNPTQESYDDKLDRYLSLTNEEVAALSNADYQDVYDTLESANKHDLNRAYEAARMGDSDLANRFRAVNDKNMSGKLSFDELGELGVERAKLQVKLYRKQGNDRLADQVMKNYDLEPEPKSFTEMDGVKVDSYYSHRVFGRVLVTKIVESTGKKSGVNGRSLYDVEFVDRNDKPANQGLNSFKEDIAAGEADKAASEKVSKAYSDWSSWYRSTTGDFPSDKLSQEAHQKAQNGEDLTGFGVLPTKKTAASPTAAIDAEIESLRGLIGTKEFDTRIDALIEDIDSKRLMAQYEPKLLELDRDHANAKAAKARG